MTSRIMWFAVHLLDAHAAPRGEGGARTTTGPLAGVVQLRLQSKLTSEEYVTGKAWLDSSLRLRACPEHRRGGCGFRSCGYYDRKVPEGVRIPRWYCPKAHCTFVTVRPSMS